MNWGTLNVTKYGVIHSFQKLSPKLFLCSQIIGKYRYSTRQLVGLDHIKVINSPVWPGLNLNIKGWAFGKFIISKGVSAVKW